MARRTSRRKRKSQKELHYMAQPTHLVLFRQVSEENTDFIRGALKVEAMAGVRADMGTLEFGSADSGAHVSVYETMGIAAVTAETEDVERLKSDPSVEDVFANEERHVPEPVTGTDESGFEPAEIPGMDYLLGLREGIDTSIAALAGIRRAPAIPAEGRAAEQTGASDRTWGLSAVGVTAGCPYTGEGVKVAVLDTGIDLDHPDFQNRVVEHMNARSFIPGQNVQDGNGHGTHCCGTVAGPETSTGGVRYGVAPNVDLLVGKVLSDGGSGWDNQIIDGIQWAVSQGARVISMSLGSKRRQNQPYNRLYERVTERLLEGSPGVLVVAAAGNASRRPLFTQPVENPAACPSIMAVAAVDRNLTIARFSCRQMDGIAAVDLSGPGVRVYSSVPGGGFDYKSGTSMATPHVAGIAALYCEATPSLSASELWDRLISDARPLGDPADFGAGIVHAP